MDTHGFFYCFGGTGRHDRGYFAIHLNTSQKSIEVIRLIPAGSPARGGKAPETASVIQYQSMRRRNKCAFGGAGQDSNKTSLPLETMLI
jgi:hypothetical protein